jgi:Pectate lyase
MWAKRFHGSRTAALVIVVFALVLSPAIGSPPEAYQGFGATTRGGTGGAVVRVTTLADSGPGSLREALSGGNRTVVFDVAGEIALSTYLYVYGANITIDGFSAPAPGITLKNYGLIIRGNRGAHDIIVRGIRVRGAAIDGIQVANSAYNVVIDHVSVTGSLDGNIDITEGARDVTVSWSIIGGNEKNMLVKYNASRVSLHHNLFTASAQRSPQIRIDDSTTAVASGTTADIRNNVIANWGTGHGSVVWYGPWANVVNNYYVAAGARHPLTVTAARAHVAGNLAPGLADVNEQGNEAHPFAAPPVDTQEACSAAALVLAQAGARPLDALDQRLLTAVTAPTCAVTPPMLDANTIPRGATISSAVLHLVASRKGDRAYPISIRYLGEAADHSSPIIKKPGRPHRAAEDRGSESRRTLTAFDEDPERSAVLTVTYRNP